MQFSKTFPSLIAGDIKRVGVISFCGAVPTGHKALTITVTAHKLKHFKLEMCVLFMSPSSAHCR